MHFMLRPISIATLAILTICGQYSFAQHELASWFPPKTRAFLSVDDLSQVDDKVANTGLGRIGSNPQIAEFVSSLRNNEVRLSKFLQEAYGLDSEKLLSLATKRIAIAGIEVDDHKISMSLIVELETEQAQQLIQAAEDYLESIGAKRKTSADFPDAILLELPDGEQVLYRFKDRHLLVSGDTQAAKEIGNLWGGLKKSESLAGSETFKKCIRHDPDSPKSDILWFADLISLALAAELNAEGRQPLPAGVVPFAQRHGFDSIKGAGGQAWIKAESFDFMNEINIYAPDPKKFIASLQFTPGDTTPPPYVADSVTSQITVRWGMFPFFSNLGPVYDDITDASGAWDGTLGDWKSKMGFDLMEVLQLLDPELSMTTDLNIEEKRERTITSIKLKDAAEERRVATALYRFWRKDGKATRSKVPGHRYDLWQIRTSGQGGAGGFSRAGMMVADGRVWISTHASMIRELLTTKPETPLANDPEFLDATKRTQAWLDDASFARTFVRMDQDIRNTYEVLRNDGIDALQDVESLYSRALLGILAQTEIEDEQKPDFSKLPAFNDIAPDLGITAGVGSLRSDGWTIRFGTYTR